MKTVVVKLTTTAVFEVEDDVGYEQWIRKLKGLQRKNTELARKSGAKRAVTSRGYEVLKQPDGTLKGFVSKEGKDGDPGH